MVAVTSTVWNTGTCGTCGTCALATVVRAVAARTPRPAVGERDVGGELDQGDVDGRF